MRILRHDVTVVVPTMDEADNIVRFLGSIPRDLDVVVVDSSTDRTPEIIAEVRPGTRVIRAKANIPVARQIGSHAAFGGWLLFTDADVVFAADYFDRLAELDVPNGTGGVVGTKSTVAGFDLYHRCFARGQRRLTRLGIPAATGSNMMVSRAAMHHVGGFDPTLAVNEDTELMFRIRRAGYHVAFGDSLTVLSFDHRRLEAGLARKVFHGAVRNTALYLGLFPERVRRSDWGYWSSDRSPNSLFEPR